MTTDPESKMKRRPHSSTRYQLQPSVRMQTRQAQWEHATIMEKKENTHVGIVLKT
jgi:hypothetical protein